MTLRANEPTKPMVTVWPILICAEALTACVETTGSAEANKLTPLTDSMLASSMRAETACSISLDE